MAGQSSDPVAALLMKTPTTPQQRAEAWDAYESASNEDELAVTLKGMKLPEQVKAQLWELKSQSAAPPLNDSLRAPAPESQIDPRVEEYRRAGIEFVSDEQGQKGFDRLSGAASGAASTVFHGGDLIRRALGMERVIDRPEVQAGISPPDTPEGRQGFAVEQLGEFLVPFGGQANAARYAARLPKWAQRLARMTGEAAEFGGKAAAQTGGDAEAVMTATLLGGVSPAVAPFFQGVGKLFTRVLPERLYTQVFKVAEDDWRQAIQSQARGGTVDPTLAREVLERGLFGSSRNMAVYAVKKLSDLEGKVQGLVKQTGPGGVVVRPKIDLPKKQDFINLLKMLEDEFGKGFFAERAKDAMQLRTSFQRIGGTQVLAEDALKVKRFLDRMRNTTSFRLDPRLSAKQDELRTAANLVRSTLKQDEKFAKLMDEERIFIEALDSIVDDAVKRQNRRLLGLTDIMLGGGGLATGWGVAGFGAMGAARAFQNPFTLTGLGQGLFRIGSTAATVAPAIEPAARLGAATAVQGTR